MYSSQPLRFVQLFPLALTLDSQFNCCSIYPGTSEEGTDRAYLERQLDDIIRFLKTKLQEDTTFTAPVKSFVNNFQKLKTDSAVQSALFSFGKKTTLQQSYMPGQGASSKPALQLVCNRLQCRGERQLWEEEESLAPVDPPKFPEGIILTPGKGGQKLYPTACLSVCRKIPPLPKITSCWTLVKYHTKPPPLAGHCPCVYIIF